MKNIKIEGEKIMLELKTGNAYGKWYMIGDELGLEARTSLDLAQLMRYEKEIKKELERINQK